MIARSERTKAIERLESEFNGAGGIYLADIERINVEKISRLRRAFRKNGIRYIVVKNTLARIALERCGKNQITQFLKGQTGAVIAGNEPTAPAKIIRDFHKENKDLLKIKAALVDGMVLEGEQAERLADIPSREILLAQLLSCLNAPVAQFAGVLRGILTKFAGTIDSLRAKKEAEQQ